METNPVEKNFVERTKENRLKQAEKIAYVMLAEGLKADLPHLDFFYIKARALEAIQTVCKKLRFANKKIREQRMLLLKTRAAEIMSEIAAPVTDPEPLTEARNTRCEPLVKTLLAEVLNEAVLFSDEDYYNEAIENDDMMMLLTAVYGYIEATDELLLVNLGESKRRADKKVWGADRTDITMKMIDEALKRK